ncbi:multiple sugar transport system substrate-binding protein [Halarchaeum solikamskense]|uniref:ABC transporter substrate-binding protein n=1 Tax=Halarchaeum nitratireducens TaxID=489913 RepID=UPI001B3ACD64|nr:ABC transporter substrate-binding protein [Halarchaeum solikamskense]MBP2252362.1 multiple sugar transport system substrate-binding protein [Halarchaeum solikamskense]
MTGDRLSTSTRRRFIAAAGVTGSIALAGCMGGDGSSGGGGGSDSYTITFWELFSGGEGPVMKDIVQKFNDEQPLDVEEEVTINRQRTPWAQYYNKLYTALTSGSGPDMAIMHAAYLRSWNNVIDPIGDYLETSDIESDYLDNHWDLVTVEGETRALPMDLHPLGGYYNKDVFESAGLDPESPPTNWEEFQTAGNAIVDQTDNAAFSQSPANDGFGSWRTWSSLVKQQGGTLFDSDWNPSFNNQAGQNTSQLFWDMTGDMGWSPQTTEADWGTNAFSNGNLGMTMNGTWYVASLSDVEDLNWGFFKPNVAPNRSQEAVWADGHTVVLPRSQSRGQRKSELAAKAAHWMTTENPEWGARAGHLPAAADIRESEVFQNSPFYDKTLSKYLEMAENDVYFYQPKVPNGDPTSQDWYQWLRDLWGHNYENPQAALEDGVSTISNGIKE